MEAFAVSPCSNPEMNLDEVLSEYSKIGYSKLELFTSWVSSAVDWRKEPEHYLRLARSYGMSYVSLHLPTVTEDTEATLRNAVMAARFAESLGVKVVLFKAASRELYVQAAGDFLDAIRGFNIIPVLQNHADSPIATLEDYKEVLAGIDDSRMRTLLEVGHFHSVGVSWREGFELLGETIALIHIKDQIGSQSVPFGKGEIDLSGLFRHTKKAEYKGDYIVEMEVRDKENTVEYLRAARQQIGLWTSELGL